MLRIFILVVLFSASFAYDHNYREDTYDAAMYDENGWPVDETPIVQEEWMANIMQNEEDHSQLLRECQKNELWTPLCDRPRFYSAAYAATPNQEYIQHSTLISPNTNTDDSEIEIDNVVRGKMLKSLNTHLPSYCHPPNPCPLGYTAEEGCVETFDNSAAFSREYQATQRCLCDTEHMSECPDGNPRLDDVVTNNFLGRHFNAVEDGGMVSKKFQQEMNPYLVGAMLPIAAKKGIGEKI